MNMRRNRNQSSTPEAETDIDAGLVGALLADQRPDMANMEITPADEGWDNATYRLGKQLAVRLPRRARSASLIAKEQRWLPVLSAHLPLPVPVPVYTGEPSRGYPWHWSVVPWLTGQTANLTPLDPGEASLLGMFLRALHVAAPTDAPENPYRGVALQTKAADTDDKLHRLADRVSKPVRSLWQDALTTPIDMPPVWIHGDLHARNVLVENGAISGVIDWGDLCAGDPATDLAALWTVLPDAVARHHALAAYGVISDNTLRRAKGWAAFLGIILLDTGLTDHPAHAAMGETILRRLG